MRGKTWSAATAAAALLAGAAALPYARPALADNRWGASYFPNVPLITQDGATVRFYDDLLKGKAVVVNAIYTHCKDECPLETARLAEVQRRLGGRVGKDIFFYSITIDPRRDTPEALKAYAERFHAGPGWLFLTGDEGDIKLVSRKLGLWSATDAASRDGHRPTLMIGNEATGQWMRNSALDNPRFLAVTISDFLTGWKDRKPGRSYEEVARLPALDKGRYLFQTRCGACHTTGHGDRLGPDLSGVTSRRERDWLARYLAAPDRMLAGKDPIATSLFAKYGTPMPNLDLSASEITTLLSYLEAQDRAPRDPERRDSVSAQ